MLLNQTHLHIYKGHKYALVGHNGAGKTTLMTRLAKNDIRGFPQDLKCVYVKHEILSERVCMRVYVYIYVNVCTFVRGEMLIRVRWKYALMARLTKIDIYFVRKL